MSAEGKISMARDREQTKEKIIAAVGQLLAKEGFRNFGVNALARQAGVDKVLVYRYFGGLPGLLRAYGESVDFWPTLAEVVGGEVESFRGKDLGEGVGDILVNFARALRRRPLTQEIMAWEMVEQNELTLVLAEMREDWAQRLFKTFADDIVATDLDLPAVTALLGAAINYLVIRGRTTSVFNLIEIDNDLGWLRLETTLRTLCQRCFSTNPGS